jgi:hypothetical protein
VANSKRRDANVLFSSNSGEFEVRLMVPSGEDVSVHDSRDVVGWVAGWLNYRERLCGVWMKIDEDVVGWGVFLLQMQLLHEQHYFLLTPTTNIAVIMLWWCTTHNILSHLPNLISLSTKR